MRELAINPDDLKRVETEEDIAIKAGFALQAPIYALGTPVNEVGEENYRALRRDFEKLPVFKRLVKDALAQIEGEKRADGHGKICDLKMSEDGTIEVPGQCAPLHISKRAFEQLLYRAGMPRGSASYHEN